MEDSCVFFCLHASGECDLSLSLSSHTLSLSGPVCLYPRASGGGRGRSHPCVPLCHKGEAHLADCHHTSVSHPSRPPPLQPAHRAVLQLLCPSATRTGGSHREQYLAVSTVVIAAHFMTWSRRTSLTAHSQLSLPLVDMEPDTQGRVSTHSQFTGTLKVLPRQ